MTIFNPDDSEVTEIVLPDGSQAGEVVAPDGSVVWTAAADIPDTSMFQDPIYQWWGGEGIGVSDGQEATSWDDQLASITGSAVGSPTYRADQSGFEAVEYGGSSDGHDYSPDGQQPTADSSLSIVALYYTDDTSQLGVVSGLDDAYMAINSGSYTTLTSGTANPDGGSPPSGSWDTIGYRYDSGNSSHTTFGGGSSVNQLTGVSRSFGTADNSHGYRAGGSDSYFSGYIAEVIITATAESDQAFADYHNDRLG